MRPVARQELIVGYLSRQGRMTVDGLAASLSASRETIRRDLAALARAGRIRKYHGGAAPVGPSDTGSVTEGSFQARMGENVAAKRAVGQAAAALFKAGDSIFVDTGTTTVLFAEELGKLAGLTVITNSAMAAQHVGRSGQNRVFLVGGEYRDGSAQNVGRMAVEQIATLRAAHAVLTVGSIDVDGILDFDPEETEIARAMIAQARSVTVIADGSKLGRPAVFKVCDYSRIQRLVIDVPPEGEIRRALMAAGVEILVTG
ncbi:DeoR/GlpR family DNA-binding transcription regulator [uncultured Alsobacter sp.]|uniref:DeoR/GlpR family DNA-binding transcription regulator n=1 Tax=uncultured Alsobacter sp. TaxID=1748258 RepID=UPI0025F5EF54|nr:DeoR/GlpR family DNA-binding transcription regulator [uncultured Alsobacter sp.]